MTDDAAAIVYDEIQKTDVLTGARIQFAASEDGEVSCSGGNIHDVLWAEGTEPGNGFTAPAAVYT